MKSGFTLIEVLVAIAISSLLAMMLMNTFFQVNTSTQLVDDITNMQMRASVLFHQIEKDLRGAYVPSSVLAALHTSEQNKEKKAQKEEGKTKEKQQEVEAEEGSDKNKELIPQVFVSKNGAGGMLEQLTFITDNPLVVYWGETVGKPHQRRARVTYRLKEEADEGNPIAYRLVRYELADFAKVPDETQTGIEVIGGIKSIVIMYRAREKEESKNKTGENEQKIEKKQEKIEERSVWDTDEQIASDKEDEHVHLPNLVLIDIALWAEGREYAETFSYAIPLEIDSAVIPAAVQKRNPAKKKENQGDIKKDNKGGSEKKPGVQKETEEAKIKPMQQLFQKGDK